MPLHAIIYLAEPSIYRYALVYIGLYQAGLVYTSIYQNIKGTYGMEVWKVWAVYSRTCPYVPLYTATYLAQVLPMYAAPHPAVAAGK